MAGLLDDLMNAYGTAGGYAGNALSALGKMIRGNPTGGSITDALNADPVAMQQGRAAPPVASYQMPSASVTAARQGVVQDGLTDPQVIPISAQEAARAQAQQAPSQAPAQAPQAQAVAPAPVAQVNTGTSFPSASDYNADGTQAAPGSDAAASQPAGGLLGSLAGAASDAVNDPVKSKGLLSALGDAVSGLGSKLQNMSPAASQSLLAAGMTMLQNNDGRHNLAQLVGDGGVSGLNAYQTVNANRIAMAKNAFDIQHMQNQDAVAQQNADTEAAKAGRVVTSPGQTVTQFGPGGGPGQVVATGGVKAAGTREIINADGTKTTVATDETGKIIPGTETTSNNQNAVGPLTPDQLKVVNSVSDKATQDQAALARTQGMLSRLQTANIPAGLKAKGQDLWTQITGDQNDGQVLRSQLQQQTYQAYLATWKPGIGGRLTNTDVNLLKQGMPPDTASSQTWTKFLTSYGKLQADVADQSTRAAAFTAQNRGDQGVLHAPLTVGGMTYPAGLSYQQVVMGRGGTPAQQSGQNSGVGNAALLAEAQRRGLKQNANGQWVVSQ